jgi:hypothetical protein
MSKSSYILALVSSVLLSACSTSRADTTHNEDEGVSVPPAAGEQPTQYIIGIDVSDSFQTPARIDEARGIVEGVIKHMTYGDAIAIVETFRSGTDSVGSWTDSIPREHHLGSPTGSERHRLAQFKLRASTIAGGFVHPPKPATSTDILALVQRASDYATAAKLHGRKTTLLVVSDMMNYSDGLRMTNAGSIPGAAWVAKQKAAGLVPALPGVCVAVSGADVSSARGVAVRNFWQSYFGAAGANFSPDRYRKLMLDAGQVSCS